MIIIITSVVFADVTFGIFDVVKTETYFVVDCGLMLLVTSGILVVGAIETVVFALV